MSQFKAHCATLTVAAALAGAPALADVTAEQVWQAWVDYSADMGQEVTTGGQEMSGDTLVITDAVFSGSQDEADFTLTIPEIRLRETGGMVEVTTSSEVPMSVTGTGEAGEAVDMSMLVRHLGMVTVVSGTPEEMTYRFNAQEIGFEMGDMMVEGEPIDLSFAITARDAVGQYQMTEGDLRNITSTLSAAGADYSLSATDPEEGGTLNLEGQISDITGESVMSMPQDMNPDDMPAALAAGFSATGGFRYGAGQTKMDFADEGETVTADIKGTGGVFDVSLSRDGLVYEVGGTGTEVMIQSSSLPFPVNASLAESGFSFTMPMAKGQNAPIGVGLRLVDLSVSEQIWAMIDPTGQLPHDPATLIVELAGRVNMFHDLTDPAIEEMDEPPGEIESLDLEALQVKIAGAELTGQGGLTFDNSDMSMGFPKPQGSVDLTLTGANALMDKLVAMGLLPEDQVMGARMMMGLFAVPTGEDSLASKIEFREDGGIYANGQRIQ